MGTQCCRDCREVGLGASDEEMDVQIVSVAESGDQVACFFAIGVFSIPGSLLHVRFCQLAKDVRMGAFTVVTVE